MFKLIKKDYTAFGHLVLYQFILVMMLMSFGLFIDQKGTMTFVALLLYPMLIPMLMLISDKQYFSLCNAIPVSRSKFVLSKYIGGFAGVFLVIGLGMLYGHIVTTYFNDSVNFSQIFSLKGICFIIVPVVLINGLTFPIFFKFSSKNSAIALAISFGVLVMLVLVGVVYVEKTLKTSGISYTDQDIFPVAMYYLANYIKRVGENTFLLQLILGTTGYLAISILLSLWGFSTKDIDD